MAEIGAAHPMPSVTILCGGGHRSGSTWQYNAVRAILCEKGISHYGAWIETYDSARPEPAHVVKLHRSGLMSRFPDALVVGCYRDLRDVVASLDRMGWLNNGRARGIRRLIDRVSSLNRRFTVRRFLDGYVASTAAWTERAVHMMRYEDMVASPASEMRRLADAIGFPLDAEQAERLAERLAALRPPGEAPAETPGGADHETLLHPGHIGGGGDAGDLRTRRFIARRYRGWLSAHGYAID